MLTPILQEGENYYKGFFTKEGQKIYKQIRKRQKELSGKKTDLKIIYTEFKKMSYKPNVELLQVRTKGWKCIIWSSHVRCPLDGTRVYSFISCILRLESLLVGNIIEKVLLMQITIEQALQNCDEGDCSGNIPFSKSFVNWFCKNQKGTTFVLPFNVLISNWAMGEILDTFINFHLLLEHPRFELPLVWGILNF